LRGALRGGAFLGALLLPQTKVDTMAQANRKNVTSNGLSDDVVEQMRLRLDALEVENKALKERQNGGLSIKFEAKGTPYGKKGLVRERDVVIVSGGAIGFPITHGPAKWFALKSIIDRVIEFMVGMGLKAA